MRFLFGIKVMFSCAPCSLHRYRVMEQTVDRSTKNIWELLTKSEKLNLKGLVKMIRIIFPSFKSAAEDMVNDRTPLDLSAYYARVHGHSRMLEIMQSVKEAGITGDLKAAMTGLTIRNDSGSHSYIVVNAVNDEGLHVVRISDKKRVQEMHDSIFSSLTGTILIPRAQCRTFHLEQAPPRLVIGTPPPPMTEAERALKSTARQLKIAQNKEAKAKKAKKNADGCYNPAEGEEELEDSDQSEDEEGKPRNPKKTKGAQAQAAEPGEASKRGVRETRMIEPKEVIEKITYMRRVIRDAADLPEAQEWEKVEEIVYKETLGIYEEQREVPEHVQQQVEDILKVLSPAVVVVMLTNAGHTIEKLKAALKTINKDKPPWQHNMLKGLGLTPQEQAEIKARSAIRENPDIQEAVANKQGWVSDYHISVIPVIMKQLDEFVGEDPKKPAEDLAASAGRRRHHEQEAYQAPPESKRGGAVQIGTKPGKENSRGRQETEGDWGVSSHRGHAQEKTHSQHVPDFQHTGLLWGMEKRAWASRGAHRRLSGPARAFFRGAEGYAHRQQGHHQQGVDEDGHIRFNLRGHRARPHREPDHGERGATKTVHAALRVRPQGHVHPVERTCVVQRLHD